MVHVPRVMASGSLTAGVEAGSPAATGSSAAWSHELKSTRGSDVRHAGTRRGVLYCVWLRSLDMLEGGGDGGRSRVGREGGGVSFGPSTKELRTSTWLQWTEQKLSSICMPSPAGSHSVATESEVSVRPFSSQTTPSPFSPSSFISNVTTKIVIFDGTSPSFPRTAFNAWTGAVEQASGSQRRTYKRRF